MLEQKFLGPLNSDDPDRDLKESIRDCLNLVPQKGGRGSSPRRESLKGTTSVFDGVPITGTNKTVGVFKDKNNEQVFFFNYNSLGNHGIYVNTINKTYTVVESSALNFTEETVVSGAGVIDKTLIWTDGVNPVGAVDFQRAIDTYNARNARKYELVFDKDDVVDASPINITLNFTFGSSVVPLNATSDIDTTIDNWVAQIDGVNGVDAVRCGDVIEITEDSNSIGTLTGIDSTDIVLQVVPINVYLTPITSRELTLANEPIQCEPKTSYVTDLTRKQNYLQGKQFQFRSRLVYFDNTKSVLSPVSDLAFNKSCNENDVSGNCLEVDFNDGYFGGRELSLVKNVEVYFREGNLGTWFLADSLTRAEFINGKYSFYNDGVYQALDDLTSNKNFDDIPIKANSLTTLKNRLFLGGTTEGYDTPCVEADLSLDIQDLNINDSSNTWTIEGYIRIVNPFLNNDNFRNSQAIWEDTTENGGEANVPVYGGIPPSPLGVISDVGDKFLQYIPQGGFTVYLAGTQHRATSKQVYLSSGAAANLDDPPEVYNLDTDLSDVRDLIKDNDDQKAYSKFSIDGVKPGRYILRVASHLCYDGEKPSYINDPAGIYQINNSLEWQKTSANILSTQTTIQDFTDFKVDVAESNPVLPDGVYEIEIELGTSGGTLDLSSSGKVITIADLSDPSLGVSIGSQFYVRDSVIGDRGTTIEDSASVELSSVELNNTASPPIVKTDHNGYGYFSVGNSLSGYRPKIYSGQNLLKDRGDKNMLKGYNLSNVVDGSAGDETDPVEKFSGGLNSLSEYIILATDSEVQDTSRTLVKGVATVDGDPLSGALIVAKNGRHTFTDSQGGYSLLMFSDSDSSGVTWQRNAELYLNAAISSCLNDSNPLESAREKTFSILYGPNPNYNDDNPFEPVDFIITGVTDTTLSSSFRRGGAYQFGVIYYDEFLRSSLVYTEIDLKINIPFYTEDLNDVLPLDFPVANTFRFGNPIISWSVNSPPPSWAKYWRWVRTKDLSQQNYLHWVANDIEYLLSSSIDGNGDFDNLTTYNNGDAKTIGVGLKNIVTYGEENNDSKIGYTYNEGDRLIIIKNNDIYLKEYIDLEIRGQQGDYVFIESLASLSELKAGDEFLIYSPKAAADNNLYYEFGDCYKVTSGFHEGPTQNQTASLPATGTFTSGDTYKVERVVPITGQSPATLIFDHHSILDSIDSKDQAIGRVAVWNPDVTQQFFFSKIRFSNPFVQDSFINGIKSFDNQDEEALPNERGVIRKLIGTHNTVLAIHETETTSVYVNESYLRSPDGSGVLTQTDRVIGDENLLKGGFGTINPESVVEWNDNVFWWDDMKAEPIMYSVNGLEPLGSSRKMRNKFLEIQKERKLHVQSNPEDYSRVYGGYDPEKKMFILAFNDMGVIDGVTIGFNDDYNYWSTRFSFKPEFFVDNLNNLYSFKDGEMWKHDDDDSNHNTFYGVKHPVKWTLVSNEVDHMEKIYRSLSVKTNVLFDVTSISNREGQETDLVKADLVRRDDMFYADILRDKNTPTDTLSVGQTPLLHGNVMRSQVSEMTFESDESDKVFVEYIIIDMQESPGHLLGAKR